MGMINKIIHGDCLDIMKRIPDGVIDMILCDLPYGTTKCKWDSIIPLDLLWNQYKRIINPKGAIVLFSGEPFTSLLISSQINMFKYKWTWSKNKITGFMQAKVAPLRSIEDICVFSHSSIDGARPSTQMKYFPQNLLDTNKTYKFGDREIYGKNKPRTVTQTKTGYPRDLIYFDIPDVSNRLHPTQKPVDLCEYLIRTYTDENNIVLDSCIGSGTTAIACIRTKRRFVGIEKDKHYWEIANQRVEAEYNGTNLAGDK